GAAVRDGAFHVVAGGTGSGVPTQGDSAFLILLGRGETGGRGGDLGRRGDREARAGDGAVGHAAREGAGFYGGAAREGERRGVLSGTRSRHAAVERVADRRAGGAIGERDRKGAGECATVGRNRGRGDDGRGRSR